MEIGGSQLNAAQLAGAVRDRGHEVIVIFEQVRWWSASAAWGWSTCRSRSLGGAHP